MHYNFCTYFDRNYLTRGVVLYQSLKRHCRSPFTLWVLCFDDQTYDVLSSLDLAGVKLISQQAFEAGDAALVNTKANRSQVEYYWTCTPSVPLYILRHNPDVDVITYLDADLCFFSDPQPIYDEFGDGSILIIEHRYAPKHAHLAAAAGIYNVGTMAFRRDDHGLSCLSWWRARCLEWCYVRYENNKFGDQKYLDDWPARFPGVVVLKHKGAGLAPWNLTRYRVSMVSDRIAVDSIPLIFYHYHGFKHIRRRVCAPANPAYAMPLPQALILYRTYAAALEDASRMVCGVAPSLKAPRENTTLGQVVLGLLSGRFMWLGMAPVTYFLRFGIAPVAYVLRTVADMRNRLRRRLE